MDELDHFLGTSNTPASAPAVPAPDELDHFLAAPAPVVAAAPPAIPGSSYVPPFLHDFGAGVVQGGRNMLQTVGGWIDEAGNKVNAAVPALAKLDAWTGFGEGVPRVVNALTGQTEDYRKQYGTSIPAGVGEVVGDIASTLPFTGAAGVGALGRAVPVVGRVLGPAAEGAVAGGVGNALVSGGTGQDPLTAAGEGALGGAVLGGALPLAGAGYRALGGGAPTALTDIADRLGIDLSTGQRVGGVAKRIEDLGTGVPGSGSAQFERQQNSQIASVIAKEGGIPGPVAKLTTPVVSDGLEAAGKRMETAAGKIDVPGDNTTLGNLGNIQTNASVAGADAPQAKAVATLNDRILNIMANNNGTMPGSEFQKFIAKGGELDAAIKSSNPDVSHAAQQIKDALVDAATRSGSASADAVKDLSNARYHYKVLKTVQPVIDASAEGSESMSQAALARRIRGNFDMSQTGPNSNMPDLAKLIEGVKPLRSSGTAERAAWYSALGIGGGGGLAYAMMHPEQADDMLGQALPAAAALGLGGRALRFGPSLGAPGVGSVMNAASPLLPRLYGPRVGRNMLADPPPANQLAAP